MVVRDCADTLRPLLEKLRPHVDQLVIGLGGTSKDGTDRIARKYGDVVINVGEHFPADGMFDFAAARNALLPHVQGQFMGWCDGDDDIDHPEILKRMCEAMNQNGIDRLDMDYQYAWDKHGNLMTEHRRERILRVAKDWRWLDQVHETANTDLPHAAAYCNEITIIHKRGDDGGVSTDRNLPILERMAAEDPKPRTLLHLAHGYYSCGKWQSAIETYERYVAAPENDVNQWSACVMASRACARMEDWPRSMSWAMSAASLCPQYQDAYTLLASAVWYAEQDADKAGAWVEMAERAEPAPLTVFRMPMDNLTALWDIKHRVLAKQKNWQAAKDICDHALALVPDNGEWRSLALFYAECVLVEKSRQAALQLADHMVRHGDVVRAAGLLENFLPSTIRDDPAVMAAQRRVQEFLNTEDNSDAYTDADHFDGDYDVSVLPRVKFLLARLQARGATRVLEVGCHIGLISRYLARNGMECVGVDFNEGMVKIANERAQAEGLNARFVCGRFEDIEESFDAVLFPEILEHVKPSMQMRMLQRAEQMAPVVMGTVPAEPIGLCAGLWEKSDIGAETFRPHIFEFDQNDMETLILTDPDRRIINAHKLDEPQHPVPGFGNRVFEFDREPRNFAGKGIAIFLGPGWEFWTPTDIEAKGIGGSETAAHRLAVELAAQGHFVTVYGPEKGIYDGVVYRDYRAFDPDEGRDVVIYSRELAPLAARPNAEKVYLWCHDIGYGEGQFTPEIADRVDGIVLMSEWQRGWWTEHYPWLDQEKLVVIGNAIKPYDVTAERVPHRFVYTSSPDRGLDDILYSWPFIRDMWPDAELHVYYGWQYLDAGAPQLRQYKQWILDAARHLEGVYLHGRIGQQALAEEFAKAQFWLYPSILPRTSERRIGQDFHETFCISALEAQMYGAIPVTRNVGALSERFTDARVFVDPWTPDDVLSALRAWDETSEQGMAWARSAWRDNAETYTWASVADRWEELISVKVLA